MFMTSHDQYVLNNGLDGAGGFEAVGSASETVPDDESSDFIMEKGDKKLSLKYLLSYDEMQLAAFFSVAVPTYFINTGSRGNCGKLDRSGAYQPCGVYVASVGARFERRGLMEWEHIMVSQDQNTVQNGYGAQANPNNHRSILLRMWAKFYYEGTDAYNFGYSGEPILPTFDECFDMREFRNAEWEERYLDISAPHGMYETYLDKFIYKRRIKFIAESFLMEANERARAASSPDELIQAYVHVVGLGLGVWQVHPIQGSLLVEAYAEVLSEVDLEYISDIDFSWIDHKICGGAGDGDLFPSTRAGNAITVHFSRRDPAEQVPPGKLLVAQYAWDSNSYPGNEYWIGMLSASGDPAAACCSLIGELQNPYIHPEAFTMDRFRTWPDGESLCDEPSPVEPSRGSLCNDDYPMPLEAQYGDGHMSESFDEYKGLSHSDSGVGNDDGNGDGIGDMAESGGEEEKSNVRDIDEGSAAMKEGTAPACDDAFAADEGPCVEEGRRGMSAGKEMRGAQAVTIEDAEDAGAKEEDWCMVAEETSDSSAAAASTSAATVPSDVMKRIQVAKEQVQALAAKKRAESSDSLDGPCEKHSDMQA
jgi:hypothetical protein